MAPGPGRGICRLNCTASLGAYVTMRYSAGHLRSPFKGHSNLSGTQRLKGCLASLAGTRHPVAASHVGCARGHSPASWWEHRTTTAASGGHTLYRSHSGCFCGAHGGGLEFPDRPIARPVKFSSSASAFRLTSTASALHRLECCCIRQHS